jgi:hypothetical protein
VKRNFIILFLPLLLTAALRLPAEETAADPVYYIRDIAYQITGITRPFALANAAELRVGQEIGGDAALAAYVKEKTQLLLNQRVLKDARVAYAISPADPDGRIPVDLAVAVDDTWNIIALPYFKYDSNNGLELSGKARDYNFLGTMQPLKVDVGFILEKDPMDRMAFDEGTLFVDITSDTPFVLYGRDANLEFDNFFGYTADYGFEYENTTGLSVSWPVGATTLTVGVFQGLAVNEENDADFQETDGVRYEDYWYLSNWLAAEWEIPTGITVDGLGQLAYVPGAELKLKYRPGGDIGAERQGPTATFSQALEFGRVDWVGNYRQGLEVALENKNEYNLYHESWNRSASAEIAGHYPVSSFFGVSGKLTGAWFFDRADDKAAEILRGIINDAVSADCALYLNTDFPLRVIRFVPYEWFGRRWMRVLQFEQQWTPFFDFGLLADPVNRTTMRFEDALVSGGLEVVTFPLFMRSFFIRISAGFDLRQAWETGTIPDGDGREIFIGLGHHY